MTDLHRLCRELVAGRPPVPSASCAARVSAGQHGSTPAGRSHAIGSAISVAAAAWRAGRWVEAFWDAGVTSFDGAARTVGRETLFDLASVSKPVTALAAARLVRLGALDLSAPLSRYLPELDQDGTRETGRASLELLLAHRAGLVAHRPLFRALSGGKWLDRSAMLREAAASRRAESSSPASENEGFAPEYSDLGYVLVGEALARVMNRPLDEALSELVIDPLALDLGSARQWRRRDARARERTAATENVSWRGGVLRGLVHDENAWALSGDGTSGHAGLFASAAGALRLGEAVLDALAGRRADFLTAPELAPLVRLRPGATLRAGFDGKSREGSSCGIHFGPNTIGHLGFTGTSLWCDPDAELVGVLLTNRVHPTRDSQGIRTVRPEVYNAIAAWALALR